MQSSVTSSPIWEKGGRNEEKLHQSNEISFTLSSFQAKQKMVKLRQRVMSDFALIFLGGGLGKNQRGRNTIQNKRYFVFAFKL